MGSLLDIINNIKVMPIITQSLDDMINGFGKDCRLIYPPKMTACANCVGGSLNSTWTTGGPIPFPNGSICPMCNGTNYHAEEATRTIKMLVETNPAKFNSKLPGKLQTADGVIQTKGFLVDLPYVLQTRKMVAELQVEPMIRYKYNLVGEPVDANNIIQGRYFVAFWERGG